MGIQINEILKRVHLFTKHTSYVMETYDNELMHSYWGARLELTNEIPIIPIENMSSFSPNPNPADKTYSLDVIPRECPDFGRSDYRNPAIRLIGNDGSGITELKVISFHIIEGKPDLPGLPSTYALEDDKVETLQVVLEDELLQVLVYLYYSVFEDKDVITRSVQVVNHGITSVKIDTLMSANVDFYNDSDFELLHLHGAWARERQVERESVGHSTHIIDSKRGASSHQENPLLVLTRPNTDDLSGDVYSMNFVYSGSFKGLVEVNQYNSTRMQLGLNDFDFEWILKGGETFVSPEVVMVYSNQGLNGMSQIYHQLYLNNLLRGEYKTKERPLLINNWEATYFGFTEDKLHHIGSTANELGLELMVLDDGWFGVRNSDSTGLGDWFINTDKLPHGLKGIAQFMNEKELQFGLWFEPEMVSPESELYKNHLDWCLHVPGRLRGEGRNQLVLDMSREDVGDYLINVISSILEANAITYVKWDMNRHMTCVGSKQLDANQQGEVTYRYMLGLYRVIETITSRFPHILFESCSGGGGRFDPGLLYYMPQVWTSDDTDGYERQFIQYGTSLAYPQVTMASHVSVVPNHQTNRQMSLKTRGYISMMANLSYELDLSTMTAYEKEDVTHQIKLYKEIRQDIQYGRMYRLQSPYTKASIGNDSKGSVVLIESKDNQRYYLFVHRGLMKPSRTTEFIKTVYMKDGEYKMSCADELFDTFERVNTGNGPIERIKDNAKQYDLSENKSLLDQLESLGIYNSRYLNHRGITIPSEIQDFESHLYIFRKVEE